MSFGFGVGDFITVVELATKIRKRFVDAPAHLKAVSEEVKSLSSLIQDVEVDTTNRDMTTERIDRLETIVGGARSVLEDLDAFLEKNRGVSEKGRTNLKRIWSRFSFESGDARDLRARLTTHVTLLSTFLDQDLRDTIAKVQEHISEKDQQRILDWVSKEDHSALQANLLRRRQPGTRKWLLESEEWTTWTGSRGLTLYCPGIPGAGKTFTTAMAIERLQQTAKDQPAMAVSYAFCDYKRCEEHGVETTLMRLLLRGILEHCSFPPELRRLYDSAAASKRELELDETVELLRLVSLQNRHIFLVVDALDELQRDQRETLVQKLLDLQEDADLNLFFTSRKMGDIFNLFPPDTMTVEIIATKEDVHSYLSAQMKLLPSVVRKNRQLQEEIQHTIVEAVKGMFLLAELHFVSLRGKITAGAIRKALAELSTGSSGVSRAYEQAYTLAMARIEEQDAESLSVAKRTLLVISHARRPFRSLELCHALGVRDDATEFDEEDVPEISDVLALCAGLVIHQTETDIVELAHKSTKEYFESSACKWFPDAEEVMYRLCVTYIKSFEKSATHQDSPGDFPFLDYSRKHYGDHGIALEKSLLRARGPDIEATITNHTQLQSTQKLKPATTPQLLQIGLIQMTKELEEMKSGLVWASGHRKHNVARILLSSSLSRVADQIDEALEAAVGVGDLDIASMLLEFGADPLHRISVRDGAGEHLQKKHNLVFDSEGSSVDIQKVHLNPECNLFNDRCPILKSALSVATFYGQSACVRLLLDWFQDHTKVGNGDRLKINFTAAVLSAMASEHYHLIPELFPMSGSPSEISETINDPSLLHVACRWGDEVAATTILNHCIVNPNNRDRSGESALSWAARNKMHDIARYLLENKCSDPNTKNRLGQPLLSDACIRGDLKLVKILMGMTALDINAADNDHRSAISHATSHGRVGLLRLLLVRDDLQPDTLDTTGRTPLKWAIAERQTEAMRLLLRHPKVTTSLSRVDRGIHPLYLAVESDNLEALQCLLGEYSSQSLQGIGHSTAFGRLFTLAVRTQAWGTLPMLASRALEEHSTDSTTEENKSKLLHRIIANIIHREDFAISPGAPITVWEALAKLPAFTGPVGRSNCSCGLEPLHLATLTGDVTQLRGLFLLDPQLLNRTWNRTGINPIEFVVHNLPFHSGRHFVERLNEKNSEAIYLALPHILEKQSYDIEWLHQMLSKTPKGTIDSHLLFEGFEPGKSPLWCTVNNANLFRACLAATKKETFFAAFHRHESQPGPSILVYLYESWSWLRLLELYDHCPSLVGGSSRLGSDFCLHGTDETGFTLFFWAVINGSIPALKAMLALGDIDEVFNRRCTSGRAPLIYAVLHTNLEMCELLSAQPSLDINIPDNEGFTPLHHAICQAYEWCHSRLWWRPGLLWLGQRAGIIELLYLRLGVEADLNISDKYLPDSVYWRNPGIDSAEKNASRYPQMEKTPRGLAKNLVSYLLASSWIDLDAKNHGDPDSILCLVTILKFLVTLPEEDAKDPRWYGRRGDVKATR